MLELKKYNKFIPDGVVLKNIAAVQYYYYGNKYSTSECYENSCVAFEVEVPDSPDTVWIHIFRGAQYLATDVSFTAAFDTLQFDTKTNEFSESDTLYEIDSEYYIDLDHAELLSAKIIAVNNIVRAFKELWWGNADISEGTCIFDDNPSAMEELASDIIRIQKASKFEIDSKILIYQAVASFISEGAVDDLGYALEDDHSLPLHPVLKNKSRREIREFANELVKMMSECNHKLQKMDYEI